MPLPLRTLLPRDFNPVLTGESGQCAIRMVAGLLCACYMLALPHSWSNLSQTMHRVAPAAAYALFGYVWAWVTHYRLGTLKGRILVALTIDQCLVASYMHFGQEPALLWAWAMPFANIGSGTGLPGFARFQVRRLIDISATQIHEPTTTSTTPM